MARDCPAITTAANTICRVNPIAVPIRICWAATTKPAGPSISTSGTGGNIGVINAVIDTAISTRTRTGTEPALKMGAARKRAEMRRKGQ